MKRRQRQRPEPTNKARTAALRRALDAMEHAGLLGITTRGAIAARDVAAGREDAARMHAHLLIAWRWLRVANGRAGSASSEGR